jgi:hypothetical protein
MKTIKPSAAASANLYIAPTIISGMRIFVIAFAPHKHAIKITTGILNSVNADVLLLTAAVKKITQFTTLRRVLVFALKTQILLVQIANISIMFPVVAFASQTNVQLTNILIQEHATACPSIAHAQLDSTSITIQKLVNA